MRKDIDRYIIGFSDSHSLFFPENEDYVFFELLKGMSPKPNPKIVFIGAAKGDPAERWELFQNVCHKHGCQPLILSLYNMVSDNPEDYFRDADMIYIDGGATRNLIVLLREWNVIGALRNAYLSGVIMAGASAGINLFFEWCITDSLKTDLRPLAAMGVLKGSCCAHFDAQAERRTVFEKALSDRAVTLPAYGLDEGVSVVFKNEVLTSVLSLKPDANLHINTRNDGWVPSDKRRLIG